ncbi:hypothetical protein GCM10027258_63080 [Amycolatopsis stemonae]
MSTETQNGRSSKELALATAVAGPGRIGQGTAVEQSRAVAQVQAMVVVAQQFPRDMQKAIRMMRESCRYPQLAKRAFYKFPRGGTSVQGETVYLMRELLRIWGNAECGVVEMRSDYEAGESEMLSYAWDLETNSRVSKTFVVKHTRDVDGGTAPLTQGRDIYENNANHAARRERECIKSILPPWFVDEAKELCLKTLQDGGGVPLDKRIANLAAHYAQDGITMDDLERKVGRPHTKWTPVDAANIEITLTSLRNGETTRDLEFPKTDDQTPDAIAGKGENAVTAKPALPATPATGAPEGGDGEPEGKPAVPGVGTVTEQTDVEGEDLPGPGSTPSAAAGEETEGEGDAPPKAGGPKARQAQISAITTLLKDNGVEDNRTLQLAIVGILLNTPLPAFSDLSADEATYVFNRIPSLVKDGLFETTVQRARQEAGV